jgi:predicted transcriptional regulator
MSDQIAAAGAQPDFTELTADIVSAYVSKNSVRPADLPELIGSVHSALQSAGNPAPKQEATKPTPVVNPKKSVTPEYIISLFDGRRMKSMKRYLTGKGLTPQQYREMFDLPRDYPMVAPAYAQKRSELAKSMQLGKNRRGTTKAKAAATGEKVTAPAPKKRARKKAA